MEEKKLTLSQPLPGNRYTLIQCRASRSSHMVHVYRTLASAAYTGSHEYKLGAIPSTKKAVAAYLCAHHGSPGSALTRESESWFWTEKNRMLTGL